MVAAASTASARRTPQRIQEVWADTARPRALQDWFASPTERRAPRLPPLHDIPGELSTEEHMTRSSISRMQGRATHASQLRVWQQQLDRMGLRATASPVHERYVDQLRDRLERVGVRQLRFEPVPLDRWTTDTWSRRVLSGSSAGAVQTASYIPYCGRTSFAGVTGELTLIDPGPAAGTTPSAGAEVHLRPECQRAGPGRAGRTLVLPGRADPLWRARSLRYSISPQSQPRGDIAHGTVPLRNAVQRARNLRRPRFLAVAGSCRVRSGNAG